MVTRFIAIRLFATTVLLGGVALAGSAMAKPGANETTLASVSDAATVASAPSVAAVHDAAAGCTRKVKVVYAGYGEADRVGCAPLAKSAAK